MLRLSLEKMEPASKALNAVIEDASSWESAPLPLHLEVHSDFLMERQWGRSKELELGYEPRRGLESVSLAARLLDIRTMKRRPTNTQVGRRPYKVPTLTYKSDRETGLALEEPTHSVVALGNKRQRSKRTK